MKLKDIIIRYREENNMTMQVFADKCGLSKGYVSMLESGLRPQTKQEIKPSLSTYKKIAAGMGISLDELLRMVDGDETVQVGGQDGVVIEPYEKWVDKDMRLLMWFRSLPPEKQKAILYAQDAPEDLV